MISSLFSTQTFLLSVMLAPLIRVVEEKEREVVSTTALRERAMASVDWLPHRAQPMEEEATTTHRVTVATATTAGPGTSHRMYTIGKEKEEGEGRWDGTRQVLMSRGREGHGCRVVPVHGYAGSPGGGQSSWSYSGGYDEQWSGQQSPWRRQSGELIIST